MEKLIKTDELLTERETAQVINLSRQTLANWRCTRQQALPYIKVGRAVRYALSDVQNFLNQRRITPGI
jgi:predicted DNA-binding transcriptional regulator AlpA